MIKDVISKALQDLEKIAARADEEANRGAAGGEEQQKEEEEEEIDDEARANDVQDLELIRESMESNGGKRVAGSCRVLELFLHMGVDFKANWTISS
jgi:hypothetical protein